MKILQCKSVGFHTEKQLIELVLVYLSNKEFIVSLDQVF